jgi:hypothetical protein
VEVAISKTVEFDIELHERTSTKPSHVGDEESGLDAYEVSPDTQSLAPQIKLGLAR